MSKYIKLFENHAQYEAFIGGGGDTQFIKPNVSHCIGENHVHYNPLPHDYSKDYLTFVALENTTFTFTPANDNVISYSIDNGHTWTDLAADTNTPTVTRGKKVLWRGKMTPTLSNGVGKFSSTGQFEAQGNVMSLLFGDKFKGQTDLTGKDFAFVYLFSSNSNLVNAQNLSLPATTLAVNCYYNMFDGCTSLETAPKLPSTTLAAGCYHYMFYGCTSLTSAPELPATELAQSCYFGMFRGCKSLTTAPELPAETLVSSCYEQMFISCSSLNYIKAMFTTTPGIDYTDGWVGSVGSSGTFVKNSAATWDVTGRSGIPSGWTVQTATK